RLEGPNLDSLTIKGYPYEATLGKSGVGYDACGVWIQDASWAEDGSMLIWFHAETGDCGDNAISELPLKSMGVAVSHDGGITAEKIGQIIATSEVSAHPDKITGQGDAGVVRIGDYFYMYILDTFDYQPAWTTQVARSHVSDMGMPGTWWKWTGGSSWDAPGIGGVGAALPSSYILGHTPSIHAPSGNVALIWHNHAHPAPTGGLVLSFAPDGLHFTGMKEPLIHFDSVYVNPWNRGEDAPQLLGYPSLVPEQGGDAWSDSFRLFYVYLEPGASWHLRNYVQRPVTMVQMDGPQEAQVYLALSRYSSNHGDSWVTTAPALPVGEYHLEETLGYVMTAPGSGRTPLHDCLIESWGDHMLNVGSGCGGEETLRIAG
ncbi:MAG: hypothetical protein QF464_22875, partial [Myxococcota bacterium]|nr:hypothetical protein [Myxococcota bacterium]